MKCLLSLWPLVFLFILPACNFLDEEDESKADIIFDPIPKLPPTPAPLLPRKAFIQPDCFKAQAADPQFKSNDFFVGSKWNDPTVLVHNNEYILYASSPLFEDPNKIGIYRFTSEDGLQWELNPTAPVLSNLKFNWASGGVETPSVVFFNNHFHMFFTAYHINSPIQFKIGHAISVDGINWEVQNDFITSPSLKFNDFNGFITAEPGAVVFQNQLYVYFSAIGYHDDLDDSDFFPGSILQTIGLITSEDGLEWSEPEMVLRPDQSLYPRVTGGANEIYGFSTPQPVNIDNEIFLFFDVIKEQPSWHQASLSYAFSLDGKTNFEQMEEPVFTTNDFWWTDSEIRSPSPLVLDDQLKLWFAGHQTRGLQTTLGIGLATCEFN